MMQIEDPSRLPHPHPCEHCGQRHLKANHVKFIVVTDSQEFHTAWEGCATCWATREDVSRAAYEAGYQAGLAKARIEWEEEANR